MKRKALLILSAGILVVLTGCGTLFMAGTTDRRVSSLVQYLYPRKADHVDTVATPVLTLPLRVGVAFVPEQKEPGQSHDRTDALSEQQKMKLLKQVSDEFRKYPFVKTIQVIPSAYLRPAGGFENVDQLRSMFGIDVIALVSYDQLQHSSENEFSFAYLTIVGAYLVPGQDHRTHTMVDAVVYDIRSRKLLFRAPGLSVVDVRATPVNAQKELRDDSFEGFHYASTNLITNLEYELASFCTRIKDSPEEVKIVRSPGYVGGGMGALGLAEVISVGLLGVVGYYTRRTRR
jgi:rhombotail lipoprotein